MDRELTAAEIFKIEMLNENFIEFCRDNNICVMVAIVLVDSPSEGTKCMQLALDTKPHHISNSLKNRLNKVREKMNGMMLDWYDAWMKEK